MVCIDVHAYSTYITYTYTCGSTKVVSGCVCIPHVYAYHYCTTFYCRWYMYTCTRTLNLLCFRLSYLYLSLIPFALFSKSLPDCFVFLWTFRKISNFFFHSTRILIFSSFYFLLFQHNNIKSCHRYRPR